VAGYRDVFTRYIEPRLGMQRLLKLHRGHVKELLRRLSAEGFSKDTVRLTRATLSVMLGDAVEDHLLVMNPVMQLIRRGRRKQAGAITKAERQKKITPLSYEQLATFLATAERRLSRREATLMLLFADAGPRPGEALAVRWEDFDANARTLAIERAVSHGEVGPTKTDEIRTVDLTPRLAAALVGLQVEAEKEALLGGVDPARGSSPPAPARRSIRRRSPRRSAGCSAPPGCRAFGSTICGTRSPRTCSPRARRSPTSPRSSGTRSRRPR
jgi:integrase